MYRGVFLLALFIAQLIPILGCNASVDRDGEAASLAFRAGELLLYFQYVGARQMLSTPSRAGSDLERNVRRDGSFSIGY